MALPQLLLCASLIALSGCKPKKNETECLAPNKLSDGPIVHDQRTQGQIARITRLQEIFKDVDSMPLSKWIEDFSRDQNPDREIEIWEGMAGPFEAFVKKHSPNQQKKKEVYRIVLLRSGASEEETLKHHKRIALSDEEVKEIFALYTVAPRPIRIYEQK
jgi:hypothetical protein